MLSTGWNAITNSTAKGKTTACWMIKTGTAWCLGRQTSKWGVRGSLNLQWMRKITVPVKTQVWFRTGSGSCRPSTRKRGQKIKNRNKIPRLSPRHPTLALKLNLISSLSTKTHTWKINSMKDWLTQSLVWSQKHPRTPILLLNLIIIRKNITLLRAKWLPVRKWTRPPTIPGPSRCPVWRTLV